MTQRHQRSVPVGQQQHPKQKRQRKIGGRQRRRGPQQPLARVDLAHIAAAFVRVAGFGLRGHLESAKVQGGQNGRGRDPHQQPAHPGDLRAPQMQRVTDPPGIIEQRRAGRGDRADHIEIGVQEPRGRQGLKKRDRQQRGQKDKAGKQRHQRPQGPVPRAPSGMGDRNQGKDKHPQQPRIEKRPRCQMVLGGQRKDRWEDCRGAEHTENQQEQRQFKDLAADIGFASHVRRSGNLDAGTIRKSRWRPASAVRPAARLWPDRTQR